MTGGMTGGTVEVAAPAAWPSTPSPAPRVAPRPAPRDATVTELRWEAVGVVSVRLRADGPPFAPWQPGAHVDLTLPNRLTRQYSVIESDDARSWLRVAVLLDPASRGGSEYVHYFLRPGQRVLVGGPRNKFPMPPAGPLTFVAGGIGITPILPMIASATAQRREWTLDYGGRARAHMAFLDGLRAEHGDRVRAWPGDVTGRMPLARILAAAPPGTSVLACASRPVLDALERAMLESTLPIGRLHLERFKPRPRPPAVDRPVLVHAARSNVDVLVDERTSLLDGLLRAGVAVNSSCRTGVCGTCEIPVLRGVPDHRDDVLTRDQQDAGATILVCVSRSAGPELTLDV